MPDRSLSSSSRATCERKQRHRTKRLARQKAAELSKFFGHQLYPYKCAHCREWHLTRWQPAADTSERS